MLSTRNPADVDKWYDEIRGQIRTRSNPGDGRSGGLVIALTSMKSGEGVTTAALGLARSFERESRGDVLMILAKETPGDFDSMFIGVKPRVIGDDLLFASANDPERDRSEPYLVLPPMLDREPSDLRLPESTDNETVDDETMDIVGRPANDGAAVLDREPGLPAEEPGDSSDVVELPRDVIQRFGGIRPMARAMKVPASTVASWKRRGRIPRHRRQEIAEALGEPVLAEGPETDAGASTNQGASQGAGQVAGLGSGLGNPDERLARQLLKGGGLRAAEVMDFFGGSQALANALDMPMTTVQGWETENHIPDLYHATIRLAARERGGSLDTAELPFTSPAPTPSAQEQDAPRARRASLIPPETAPQADEDVLPVWQTNSARPEERFIVSLGEAGPDVMALGTCGLNGSGYGRRWENTFKQLRETYSVIIVDASSLETPIPKMWRDQTSQTLLVIDSAKTTANELRRMSRLNDLPGLRLSGTILNKTVR